MENDKREQAESIQSGDRIRFEGEWYYVVMAQVNPFGKDEVTMFLDPHADATQGFAVKMTRGAPVEVQASN
jgi:hypothetical protein